MKTYKIEELNNRSYKIVKNLGQIEEKKIRHESEPAKDPKLAAIGWCNFGKAYMLTRKINIYIVQFKNNKLARVEEVVSEEKEYIVK